MSVYNSLKDKVVLVTGGLGGIGQSIVHEFLINGSIVYVNYRILHDHENDLQESERCHFIYGDLSRIDDINDMFERIKKEQGRIDVLVNNAGILIKQPIIGTSENDWDAINDINLKGTFLCSKAAVRIMIRKKRGKIINIVSTIVDKAIIFQAAYTTTKYGIKGMTRSLAKELGRYGICVNGVSPGPISTNMNQITDNAREEIMKDMPLGRMIQAKDVAGTVIFLASSQADMITGQIISVDGGLSL